MKTVVPDYYTRFCCIGSKCRHNCCIGWEIDVDEFTLSYYKSLSGELGDRLNENICIDDEGAHFILSDGDRCPFLDTDGLCTLIKEIGEDALCDICADHPRFRNYFSDRIETGIGLSCEEAARIIVTNENDVSLVTLEDDNEREETDLHEKDFFSEREKLFSVVSDVDKSFSDKISLLCSTYNISIPENISQASDVFAGLEHLTDEWQDYLKALAEADVHVHDIFSERVYEKPFQNLLHYFLLRHFLPAESADEKRAMIGASLLSVCMIAAVFYICGSKDVESLTDISRLYSSEIEYSDVNFDVIMNTMKDDHNV